MTPTPRRSLAACLTACLTACCLTAGCAGTAAQPEAAAPPVAAAPPEVVPPEVAPPKLAVRPDPAPPVAAAERDVASLPADPADRVSEAEARAFGQAFEEAIRGGDPLAIRAMLDPLALARRSQRGARLTPRGLVELRQTSAMILQQMFSAGLAQRLLPGESYEFLRVVRRPGRTPERRVLMRLWKTDEWTYHELVLEPGPGGRPRVADLWNVGTGESLGDLLARAAQELAARDVPGASLPPELVVLGEMRLALNVGDGRAALRAYEAAPPEVRQSRALLMARLNAAPLVSVADYERAFVEFAASLGEGDPTLAVWTIEKAAFDADYAAALAAVDAVEAYAGGDPALDVLRANIHTVAGDFTPAKAAAARAAEADPRLADAHFLLIDDALRRWDFDEVLARLRTLRGLGVEVGDLRENLVYSDFLPTPQYQTWLAEQQAAGG